MWIKILCRWRYILILDPLLFYIDIRATQSISHARWIHKYLSVISVHGQNNLRTFAISVCSVLISILFLCCRFTKGPLPLLRAEKRGIWHLGKSHEMRDDEPNEHISILTYTQKSKDLSVVPVQTMHDDSIYSVCFLYFLRPFTFLRKSKNLKFFYYCFQLILRIHIQWEKSIRR